MNTTTNYYIETVANFNETEYNNAKKLKLPKQEYAILSGIVNSDSNIKPGINKVETTNAQYEIYFKKTGEFKVLDKIANEGEGINVFRRTLSRNEETRSKQFNKQLDSEEISNKRTRTYDDGIFENNSKGTYKRNRSNYDGETNSRNDINTKYSIRKSENNSGGAYGLNQWKPIGLNALTFSFWDAILFMEADCKVIFVLGFFFHNHFLKLFLLIN